MTHEQILSFPTFMPSVFSINLFYIKLSIIAKHTYIESTCEMMERRRSDVREALVGRFVHQTYKKGF